MTQNHKKNYEKDIVGDGISSVQKVLEPRSNTSNRFVKYILITISMIFLSVMLVLPLAVVVAYALRDGFIAYQEAVSDEYTVKALQLTLLATVSAVAVNTLFGIAASFLLSKYYFKGRQVMAALIDIPFTCNCWINIYIDIWKYGVDG